MSHHNLPMCDTCQASDATNYDEKRDKYMCDSCARELARDLDAAAEHAADQAADWKREERAAREHNDYHPPMPRG